MKRYTLLSTTLSLILFLGTTPVAAQTVALADASARPDFVTDRVADNDAVVVSPAVQIGFPALQKALPTLVYPVKAEKFQIEGRVLVEYTVTKRGRAKDVRILKGPGGGCEAEVKRVLRAARFQPLLDDNGKPVATRYLSAFDFRLN